MSWAISLHEVLLNQNPQFLASGVRDRGTIGEDGVGERGSALAIAAGRHTGDGGSYHLARILGVLPEVAHDVVNGHGVVILVPAIVVRHHRHRHVADLGFAGELGLLQVGDRKSTRLNSSHLVISYAVFCLKTK